MIKLLKVTVQYNYIVIDGEITSEAQSPAIAVYAKDWPSYSSGESQRVIAQTISEGEAELAASKPIAPSKKNPRKTSAVKNHPPPTPVEESPTPTEAT